MRRPATSSSMVGSDLRGEDSDDYSMDSDFGNLARAESQFTEFQFDVITMQWLVSDWILTGPRFRVVTEEELGGFKCLFDVGA